MLGGVVGLALPLRRYVDLNHAADRLLHAARLYKAGKAPIIIASGGGQLPWLGDNTPEAESMFAFLTEWGCLETQCCWRYGAAIRTRTPSSAREL